MYKLGLVGVVVAGAVAAAQPKKEPTVDYAALAERIVGTTANIKEGEIIEVSFGPNDIAFAEEIAVAIRKRGAHALLRFDSETHVRKLFATMPEKYDAQAPALDLALAKTVNARITIPAVRDASIEAAVSPARRAAWGKAAIPVADVDFQRKVRGVFLGNGFEPSPSRAKELGVSEAELAKLYWDGVAADYTAIDEKAKALKATLAAGNELRITHPNGTDVKMKVKARKVLTNDGVISDDDKKTAPTSVVWLPAGEVYLTPVPGTAEGKIVDDKHIFDGKEVTGLTLDVKAGKITNISAKTGFDAVKARYDAAGPGKTEISVIDFGINPAVKSTKIENYIIAGTVTIFTGNNTWAGGANKEPLGLNMFLPGTTVTLDGKPIVENGALK